MTGLQHQVSADWVRRYDRAIHVGYLASQSCLVVAMGAALASLLVRVPTAWIACPTVAGLLLSLAWYNASRYQLARIQRSTTELMDRKLRRL